MGPGLRGPGTVAVSGPARLGEARSIRVAGGVDSAAMSATVPAERFLPVALVEARSRRSAHRARFGAGSGRAVSRCSVPAHDSRSTGGGTTPSRALRSGAVKLTAQAQLGLGTGAVVALVLGGSVWYVLRVGRVQAPSTNGMIRRYHDRMGRRGRLAAGRHGGLPQFPHRSRSDEQVGPLVCCSGTPRISDGPLRSMVTTSDSTCSACRS